MTVLKNGFTLIEQREKSEDEFIVLAESESRKEFATWWMDTEGNTFWGNYFSYWNDDRDEQKQLASLDFKER
jgi:hypothetical protein